MQRNRQRERERETHAHTHSYQGKDGQTYTGDFRLHTHTHTQSHSKCVCVRVCVFVRVSGRTNYGREKQMGILSFFFLSLSFYPYLSGLNLPHRCRRSIRRRRRCRYITFIVYYLFVSYSYILNIYTNNIYIYIDKDIYIYIYNFS